jgi:hypothetical protein
MIPSHPYGLIYAALMGSVESKGLFHPMEQENRCPDTRRPVSVLTPAAVGPPSPGHIQAQPQGEGNNKRAKAAREGWQFECPQTKRRPEGGLLNDDQTVSDS